MMSNDFQIVRRKKQRHKQQHIATPHDNLTTVIDEGKLVSKINGACTTIKCTEFYSLVRDSITSVLSQHKGSHDRTVVQYNTEQNTGSRNQVEVVCYGLGNFSDCLIARYQLALLLALREDLQITTQHCHVYDPKFCPGEVNVLQQLGMNVIRENEEGKRRCVTPTLFYMPHCGKALYNNLLWSNWNTESLRLLVIIGNSFSNVVQNTPSRLLEKTGSYLKKISPYCCEAPFPTNFQYPDVFNDTAIHSFSGDKLVTMPTDFWLDKTEPHYQEEDMEFIPNKPSI